MVTKSLKDDIYESIKISTGGEPRGCSEVVILLWYGPHNGEETVIQALGELVDEGVLGYSNNEYYLKGCEGEGCKL